MYVLDGRCVLYNLLSIKAAIAPADLLAFAKAVKVKYQNCYVDISTKSIDSAMETSTMVQWGADGRIWRTAKFFDMDFAFVNRTINKEYPKLLKTAIKEAIISLMDCPHKEPG